MRKNRGALRVEQRSAQTLRRDQNGSAGSRSHRLLALQDLAGNGAVRRLVAGQPAGSTSASAAPRRKVVQRHASFEHMVLGDLEPSLIDAITVTQGKKTAEGAAKAKPEDREHHRVGTVSDTGHLVLHAPGVEVRQQAKHALEQELDRLLKWQQAPPSRAGVRAQNVQDQIDPEWGVRLVYVTSQHPEKRGTTVMTYGEMNAMADYFGEAEQMYRADPGHLTVRLQTIRKQKYEKLRDMYKSLFTGDKEVRKKEKMKKYGGTGYVFRTFPGADRSKGEVLDELGIQRDSSSDKGLAQSEKYFANLARNACHFAPQSWYRWKDYHEKALAKAQAVTDVKLEAAEADEAYTQLMQARRPLDAAEKKAEAVQLWSGYSEGANEAWVLNGFGDHYLQDSFAGGHLINKTLVMQWFAEWIESQHNKGTVAGILLSDAWRQIKEMTVAKQPALAAMHLYGKPATGTASDPQTVEAQATAQQRFDTSGLQADTAEAAKEAYRNYLTFLDSALVQSSTKDLHDKFCREGLWVGTDADTQAFKIYGDNNMMAGGAGAKYSAETAQMSRENIESTLTTGEPKHGIDSIMARFPNKVVLPDKKLVPLAEWQTSDYFKTTAIEVFEKAEAAVKNKAFTSMVRVTNMAGAAHGLFEKQTTVSQDVGTDLSGITTGRAGPRAAAGPTQTLQSGGIGPIPYEESLPRQAGKKIKAAAQSTGSAIIDAIMNMPPPPFPMAPVPQMNPYGDGGFF